MSGRIQSNFKVEYLAIPASTNDGNSKVDNGSVSQQSGPGRNDHPTPEVIGAKDPNTEIEIDIQVKSFLRQLLGFIDHNFKMNPGNSLPEHMKNVRILSLNSALLPTFKNPDETLNAFKQMSPEFLIQYSSHLEGLVKTMKDQLDKMKAAEPARVPVDQELFAEGLARCQHNPVYQIANITRLLFDPTDTQLPQTKKSFKRIETFSNLITPGGPRYQTKTVGEQVDLKQQMCAVRKEQEIQISLKLIVLNNFSLKGELNN